MGKNRFPPPKKRKTLRLTSDYEKNSPNSFSKAKLGPCTVGKVLQDRRDGWISCLVPPPEVPSPLHSLTVYGFQVISSSKAETSLGHLKLISPKAQRHWRKGSIYNDCGLQGVQRKERKMPQTDLQRGPASLTVEEGPLGKGGRGLGGRKKTQKWNWEHGCLLIHISFSHGEYKIETGIYLLWADTSVGGIAIRSMWHKSESFSKDSHLGSPITRIIFLARATKTAWVCFYHKHLHRFFFKKSTSWFPNILTPK